jgi:hypothetical protein
MKYAPASADEPKITWRTPLKHSKIYIALAASLLLLAMASPLVSFFTYVVSNFTAGAGGSSEPEIVLTTDTEPEINTLETENNIAEDTTADITDEETASDTTAEETAFETAADTTEPEPDPVLELFKESKILSFAPDMSTEEINNEILKGGWAIDGAGNNSDFAAGGDLWQEFCEKSERLEPCSVLLAKHYKDWADGEDFLILIEIKFDGELFYYARFNTLRDVIEDSGTYKYLMKDFYEIYKGPLNGQGLVKAYFLSNDDTWTYREWSHIQLCAISHYPRNYYRDCVTIIVHFELYDDSVSVPTGKYPVYIDSYRIWHSELFE